MARERRTTALVGALLAAAIGCGGGSTGRGTHVAPTPAPAPEARRWSTHIDVAHPLVGRLWDVRAASFTSQEALIARLSSARFVLLGEKHDNPDHHALQAELVLALVRAGRRPAVAFEMLDIDKQPLVDAFRRDPKADPKAFAAATGWKESNFAPYGDYEPIVAVALEHGLPILAANLEHHRARALVTEGLTALPAERAGELLLDRPFPAEFEGSLLEELRASHCGHLPEAMLGPMALAQHGRDAQMARVMLRADAAQGVVLVAGSGHVRLDRGVPYYLRLLAPEASIVSVRFQEVAPGITDPASYGAASGAPAFDFSWFTPRAGDGDPCAGFRAPS